jgi:hypothetical protein
MGGTPEDYVVTDYEIWMEVRLAVLINISCSFAQSIAGIVYRPNTVHPQHGLVQMLDNIVPAQLGSKQEAHSCFDRPCRPECSLDYWFMLFHCFAREPVCAVGNCRGSSKTLPRVSECASMLNVFSTCDGSS